MVLGNMYRVMAGVILAVLEAGAAGTYAAVLDDEGNVRAVEEGAAEFEAAVAGRGFVGLVTRTTSPDVLAQRLAQAARAM